MSTILKALRRLEQEKAQPVERALHEEVAVPKGAGSSSGRPRWLLPAIAVALAVVVGAGAVVFGLKSDRAAPAEEVAAAAPASPRPRQGAGRDSPAPDCPVAVRSERRQKMARHLIIAAAQMGPIARDEPRSSAVARMLALMREAKAGGAGLVVFPELALTSFFPRWYFEDQAEIVRDVEKGGAVFATNFSDQLDDASLNGDVERGGRLV